MVKDKRQGWQWGQSIVEGGELLHCEVGACCGTAGLHSPVMEAAGKYCVV